jgi:hypothetical protein
MMGLRVGAGVVENVGDMGANVVCTNLETTGVGGTIIYDGLEGFLYVFWAPLFEISVMSSFQRTMALAMLEGRPVVIVLLSFINDGF